MSSGANAARKEETGKSSSKTVAALIKGELRAFWQCSSRFERLCLLYGVREALCGALGVNLRLAA